MLICYQWPDVRGREEAKIWNITGHKKKVYNTCLLLIYANFTVHKVDSRWFVVKHSCCDMLRSETP